MITDIRQISTGERIYSLMLKYAEMGLPVIPCNGKKPLIRKWQVNKKTTRVEIQNWKKEWPEMNVGLPLGSISGIVGIDIDGKSAVSRLEELSKGNLPDTWAFETPGGGKRYLYKIPEGEVVKKYVESLEGEHNEVALLGDGQQTILPPSVHPNGGIYRWYEHRSPEDISLADAPAWLLTLMTGKKSKKTSEEKQIDIKKYKNKCSEVVLKKLAKRCKKFEHALEIQKTYGLSEEEWFLWISLLVSARFGECAIIFSKFSIKHDKRSVERISELMNKMPDGGPMIRCISFNCNECHVQKCFHNVNKNHEDNIINSPGSFIKDMKNFFKPLNPIYTPYKKALENVPDYDINEKGELCTYDNKGNLHVIANFVAKPEVEIIYDDGVTKEKIFGIVGVQYGKPLQMTHVSASNFATMSWIMEAWGIGPSVKPGFGRKDQVRDAIQSMGEDIKKVTIFRHLGWKRLSNGKWVFLHAAGCVGENNITTDIEKGLERYALPRKIRDLKEATGASKILLDIAPKEITIPLLALCYLAPLNDSLKRAEIEPNFLVWLYGGTGTRKTSISLLFLSHFGKFGGKTPPASFRDTSNAIERKAFFTKDFLLLIDDYYPEISKYESRKMLQTAQKILRMYGDRVGRGRLTSTIKFRESFPPRGQAVVTGEDVPVGQSSVARFFGIEVLKNDVNLHNLTEAQENSDLLSEAMLGYIKWLIPQMENLPEILSENFDNERCKFQKLAVHGRIGDAAAWLSMAFNMMLKYFIFAEICKEEEATVLEKLSEEIFIKLILKQNSIVNQEKPVEIFLRILKELLISGRARVEPMTPKSSQESFFITGQSIGWEDENLYYLRSGISYNLVNKFLASRGERFPISERILWKQLDEEGFIQIENGKDGKIQRCPKKAVPIENQGKKTKERLRLIHLKKTAFDLREK